MRAASSSVPAGALVFGLLFAGTRFFDFAPFGWFESAERAYPRLIVIGLAIIGLTALFRPQGIFGRREELVLERAPPQGSPAWSGVSAAVRAVDGASFVVEEGIDHVAIGPNGAGKSTLFNVVSGFLRPHDGRKRVRGRRIEEGPRTRSRGADSSARSRRRALTR